MNTISHNQSFQLPPTPSLSGNSTAVANRVRRNYRHHNHRPACTCSNRPGSVRCSRHGYIVPGDKLKRRQANKEIIRRALTPPNRKLTLRWWNFRPTPSRLSNMSTA
ncbi:uncharacterized protein LOC110612112 [Manihot esculenta]|uniref:Uncharacterized protein n=1 Tax=Manihot esculenta TaxID=3983 RepID=A0A2C9W6J8_MANES|nr:uncharacterized protein LOC110612112 [Manihot esculenta]OAY54940.1 hypothetical protein MANES_03G114400v8 [Manihot esculenta]